jgi:hypothetical protein
MSYGGLMRDADSTAVQISSIFVPRIKGAERIDSEDSGGDDSAHYASTDSGSGSVGYPKEYEIWVCPPVASDDIYPLYDCDDFSVHTGPGECPNCGKALRPIKASDIEFSLATQELLA